MKAEHVEQVTRAEKLQAEAIADTQNTVSMNKQMVAVMRHEHHTILQEEKGRHSAVLLEEQNAAANAAAEDRQAAALALQKSECFSAESKIIGNPQLSS
eukprot:8790732-Heterocapsa_arctica.AAC.1